MSYKSSFNGLLISVKGVYSAYNLTQDEVESLERTFGANSINGSNGNYTVFKNSQRHVYLNLFIHGLWKPISFDIRNDLLKLYKSHKLYEKDINLLSEKLKEMRIELHVDYDLVKRTWFICDYDKFLKLLADLISESKKNTG